jgi:hypothetical protein
MYEVPLNGEIRTIAARQGSSGIFTGSIEGLYQGYRFGSTTPDEREYVLEAPHGTIALKLVQQIVTPLPPRLKEHPFADGKDPFENPQAVFAALAALGGGPPPGVGGHGPPPGAGGPPPGAGGPPPGAGGPPPGAEGQEEVFRVHYMETKLHVVGEKSTGIFEGSTGEMEIMAPKYKMGGYLVIENEHGELRMDFLEAGTRETLNADLWINGENSTGIYAGARGELQFALTVTPPFFGKGPYSGTMWLQNEPPGNGAG